MASTKDVLDIFGDSSCIELYRLNDTLLGDGATDLTLVNGVEQYATGKFDNGFDFDGATRLSSPNPWSAEDGDLSFSFWVKATVANIGQYQRVMDLTDDVPANPIDMRVQFLTDGNLSVSATDGFGNLSTDHPVSDDTLYHCVVIIDETNSNAKVYIDTVLIDENTDWRGFNGSSLAFAYGNSTLDNRPLTGLLDQIRYINRAITEEEVGILYIEDITAPAPSSSAELALTATSNGEVVTTDSYFTFVQEVELSQTIDQFYMVQEVEQPPASAVIIERVNV